VWKIKTLYSFETYDVIVSGGYVYVYNIVYENLPENLINENMVCMLREEKLDLVLDLCNKGVLL